MDTYLTGSLCLISLLGFSYYKGYISNASTWVTVRGARIKLLLTMINNMQTDSSTINQPIESFTVNNTDASASIIYHRMNQQYTVLVPYNRKYVVPMSQFKVELLRSNDLPIDITQQPGIPYLINASRLGGYAIRITNQETGQHHEYSSEISPMYGDEVIDFE